MTDNKNINIPQKEEPDLYKRSIKSGYWVFALKASVQIMGFIKSIIVFNFLFNENLELVIIANLLIAFLTTFSETGFQAALVQKKTNISGYLNTAWVINILRGILLFTIVFLVAPLFASFKATPENVELGISVIRAMALCFVIRSFQNIGIVYFQKELQFHKTFWLTMAGSITDITLSILLVLIYRNVWGYVIARLAASVVNLVMSYLLCSYRPRFEFIPEKARELWRFGKWLFGGQIIGYLLNEGDDWFVLACLGPDALKLYRYAYRFSNLPATHITLTVSQVSFPAYSKISNDIPRLRNAYLKVLQLTTFISIPTAFLIFTLGPDFVRLFLIEQSHAMIPVIQILSLYGLMRSIGAVQGALFPAMGIMPSVFRFSLLRLVLLSIIIYPLTQFLGILGTALSILIVRLLVDPLTFMFVRKQLKCPPWDIIRQYTPPFMGSLVLAGTIVLLKNYYFKETTYVALFINSIVGIIVYFTVVFMIDLLFKCGIITTLKDFSGLRPGRKFDAAAE